MPSGAYGVRTPRSGAREAGMTGIDRERGDDITTVKTIEDVRAMKRAHKGGTWKYACACRSGVRYEGEGEAWLN